MNKNKFKFRIGFSLILILVAIALSCKKDDPYGYLNGIDPNSWAPENLIIQDISITSKQLLWEYGDNDIEGFRLNRRRGEESWEVGYRIFPKETRTWTDEEIVPDTLETYAYRLYAYAGDLQSTEAYNFVTAYFPAPTNLLVNKLNDKIFKLNWTDNSTGEQSFKIDRRKENENWETAYGIVLENQTTFVDSNVFRSFNITYRIYASYENYVSSSIITYTNAALLPPTELQLVQNSIGSVALSWSDNSNGEDGFRIERKYENGIWENVSNTTENTFEDNNFLMDTLIYYRVCSYVGDYISAYAENNFEPHFQAPENLLISNLTYQSVSIIWNYNLVGHEGFKIDRKVNEDQWEEEFLTINENDTSFIDENVDFANNNYTYRIYAYFQSKTSAKPEIMATLNFNNAEMIFIEGGTFQMGCTNEQTDCDFDEYPIHSVTVNNFGITQTEVTHTQYISFLNDIGCNPDGWFNDPELGLVLYIDTDNIYSAIRYGGSNFYFYGSNYANTPDCPVTKVTWFGANAYARWTGGRLPTEAEWEFAARGGNMATPTLFAGSNNISEVGWHMGNSDNQNHPVASLAPNELGIYDMSGNAWEWCKDWYDENYYSVSPQNNPQGPASTNYRVVRGGSWFGSWASCTMSSRHGVFGDSSGLSNGFRYVISYE